MTSTMDNALLAELSGIIAERMGLSFPEERWKDLERGFRIACKELGFEKLSDCAGWIHAGGWSAARIEALAGYLTVGETYFFRDPESFSALEGTVLPELIARREREGNFSLRLWSAGCCTGEEAYSLAVSCLLSLPDIKKWSVSILGTDINAKSLSKAKEGVYSGWSFRGAGDRLREVFFSAASPKTRAVSRTMKDLVRFDYLNLAEDAYPSIHNHTNAMDVVFCRNVLMYFTPERQARVVRALSACLVDGGFLFVAPAEANRSLFSEFESEIIDGTILFRKPPGPGGSPFMQGHSSRDVLMAAGGQTKALIKAHPAEPKKKEVPPRRSLTAASRPLPAPLTPSEPGAPAMKADLLELARLFADRGRLDDALGACRDAVAENLTDPSARFLLASILDELGRMEEAIEAMRGVLYLDQDYVLAHYALGGLFRRLGRMKESRRHYRIALEILSRAAWEDIVPESGGMTCGRLGESILAMAGE